MVVFMKNFRRAEAKKVKEASGPSSENWQV